MPPKPNVLGRAEPACDDVSDLTVLCARRTSTATTVSTAVVRPSDYPAATVSAGTTVPVDDDYTRLLLLGENCWQGSATSCATTVDGARRPV